MNRFFRLCAAGLTAALLTSTAMADSVIKVGVAQGCDSTLWGVT